MEITRDFDPIDPGEADKFSFEFTADLAAGVTLSAPAWTCALVATQPGATVDPAPAGRLAGSAAIVTVTNPATGAVRSFTTQIFSAGVAGNRYRLGATVITSDGRTLSLYAHVVCKGLE